MELLLPKLHFKTYFFRFVLNLGMPLQKKRQRMKIAKQKLQKVVIIWNGILWEHSKKSNDLQRFSHKSEKIFIFVLLTENKNKLKTFENIEMTMTKDFCCFTEQRKDNYSLKSSTVSQILRYLRQKFLFELKVTFWINKIICMSRFF